MDIEARPRASVVRECTTLRRRAEKAADHMLQTVSSARTIARLMTNQLSKAERVRIAAIEAAAPALVEARKLPDWLHTMIRKKIADGPDPS
jgi:hypothetical protein